MAAYFSRRVATTAATLAVSPSRACSATSSNRSVTPAGAEQTATSGPGQRLTMLAACLNAAPSPSDAPPNL